jgi:hypothetical protein
MARCLLNRSLESGAHRRRCINMKWLASLKPVSGEQGASPNQVRRVRIIREEPERR